MHNQLMHCQPGLLLLLQAAVAAVASGAGVRQQWSSGGRLQSQNAAGRSKGGSTKRSVSNLSGRQSRSHSRQTRHTLLRPCSNICAVLTHPKAGISRKHMCCSSGACLDVFYQYVTAACLCCASCLVVSFRPWRCQWWQCG
jgi:hypothetical protein